MSEWPWTIEDYLREITHQLTRIADALSGGPEDR